MKNSIEFVIGGAGSGKSRFALSLVNQPSENVIFVATCDAKDNEMAKKIQNHQKERPAVWTTLECSKTPFQMNENGYPRDSLVLIDSLTLWVSTLTLRGTQSGAIIKKCRQFLKNIQTRFNQIVIVSDEVGLSVVPENKMAREFRETLGAVNQEVAKISNRVYFVAAGLPIILKGEKK